MMKRWIGSWLIAFTFGLVSAYAQGATATLSGTVLDAAGAVLPEATVKVRNEDNGYERETRTDSDGRFILQALPPGRYTITAQRAGFATAENKDLVLQVGDQLEWRLRLNAAGLTESVNVVAETSALSSAPAVSTVINRQFIENLPMNGRSFQSLIVLTPGVVLTKTDFGSQGQFSVNGQRASANYFMLDGVSANTHVSVSATLGQTASGSIPGVSATGGTSNLISIDALQEFRIQTSTFAPEFGRTPGAQVSLISRAGTNELRGTLYEYFRNDVLDANDWFANSRGLKKAPIRQNNFGGVLGGPVFLPEEVFGPLGYDGRNRTFFFFSYEGLRLRQPQTRVTDVPTLSVRQSAPAALQPFLNAYPRPNGRETTRGFAEFAASYSDPSTSDATSIRLDHNVGSRLTLFGRYNNSPSKLQIRAIDNTSINTITDQKFETETATFGATLLISARLSNDFRGNWSRSRSLWFSRLDDFGGAAPPPPTAVFPAGVNPDLSLLVFGIGGSQSSFYVGKNVDNRQRQVNLVNTLALAARDHQLKLGVDYRQLKPVLGFREYSQFVNFDGATGLASGRTTTGQVESVDAAPLFFINFSAYAQDTWRASSRLTLTYGVRWDVNPPPTARAGKQLYRVVGLDNPTTMTVAAGPIYETQYANVAPRLGAAYALWRRAGFETVLRGGAGIFYDTGNSTAGNVAANFPNNARRNFTAQPYPLPPAVSAPPVITGALPISPFGFRAFDPELKLPRVYQWNLTLEQSLGAQQTISAGYVAAVGRHLLRLELLQAATLNPNFLGNVTVTRSTATSDYHALQLQYQRRLSHGLQALASYTWSHAIDIASTDASSLVRSDRLDPNLDRGDADFDVRHAVSAAITYNFPRVGWGALADGLLNGWALDSIFLARSATPVNVLTGVANLLGIQPRPNIVPGVPFYIDDPTVGGGRRINRAAFVAPTAGQQGNLPRNALRSFPVWQLDLAVRRQFNLGEEAHLQFRAEMFNALNHPNFGDPVRLLSSGLFGQADRMLGRTLSPGGGAGFNPLYQIGGPRSIQLALRLQF